MRYAPWMRRFSQDWDGGHLPMMFDNVRRRHDWFTDNPSPRQLANAVVAFGQFALKKEVVRAWPVLVKVDISPLCNLRCTYCVHARPSPEDTSVGGELLRLQSFVPAQKMSVAQFASIAEEIRGKSMAVSLYYLGDPLVHPQLDAICGLCAEARLNAQISTNFSFRLSDERIVSLVTSGLTHLTACVDGMTQESYESTRVGGRLDVVLDNLRRVPDVRRELGMRRPKIEVQFIKFRHNLHELDDAAAWSARHDVDQFTSTGDTCTTTPTSRREIATSSHRSTIAACRNALRKEIGTSTQPSQEENTRGPGTPHDLRAPP